MERQGLPKHLRHRIGGPAPVAPVLLQLTPVSGWSSDNARFARPSKPIDGFARQATEPDRPGSRSPWCAAVGGRVAPAGLSRGPVDRGVSSGWVARRCSRPAPPMRSGGRRCSGRDGRGGDRIPAGHVMLLNDSGNSVCRSLPLAGVARPGWSRPRHGLGRAGGDPDAARGRVHRCRDPYGRGRCVQQLLRCAQHGSRLTNQTSSPTVASPRGRPPWAAGRGEDTLLVSTDSWFHRPAWIPEVVVKSAKFHTCSQTTASMRSKPDVHAEVFDPVFLAPGLRLRPSAGRHTCRGRRGGR
jgi:hypothetical protein